MKLLVADSQYSYRSQRDKATATGVKVVIPYPANQIPGRKGLLRIERFFRIHESAKEKQANRVRSSVERVNSRCKQKLCLNNHKVRSRKRITIHSLLCLIAMLLNAVAAVRLKTVEKVSPLTLLAR